MSSDIGLYLHRRRFHVRFGRNTFDNFIATSGVSQFSNLGTLFFLMFSLLITQNLSELVIPKCLQVFSRSYVPSYKEDHLTLKQYIDMLLNWYGGIA